MIHLIKYVALAIGVAFNGSAVDQIDFSAAHLEQEKILTTTVDTLKEEVTQIPAQAINSHEGQIPEQPGQFHACGHDHSIDVMKKADPDYDKKLEHYTNVILPELQRQGREFREKNAGNRQATIINMPIVFHIIHKSGESIGQGQNLTDQTIIDQLETLNEDLSATNSGWPNVPPRWDAIKGNPELRFCLAEVDPSGQPTSGIVRHEYQSVPDRDFIRQTIKPQTGWPTLDYYNVWILPIPGTSAQGGVVGWAYFPFPGTPGGVLDGCVQDYRFTGKGGKTLTHEVGHSFGLPHVWGNSGGCNNDDGITDTPIQGENTNSVQRMSCNGTTWPTGPMTCGEEHMYINYMDYSPDACALTFTTGQADVMRAIALGTSSQWASRNGLVTNAQTVATACTAGAPTGGGGPTTGGGGPPIVLEHDAGIQTIISPVNGEFCSAEEIIPVVLLVNGVGDTPLTSCTIRYKISGTPGSVAFNWTGNLEKGETEEVTLAPFTSPDFSFEFTSWTTNPNGEQDENGFNDERAISLNTPEVFDPNIFEDFEDETDLPTSTNLNSIDVGNNFREWELSESVSAYGVGENALVFRNFNDPDGNGAIDIIEFPVIDFSEIENPRLAFDLAYRSSILIDGDDALEIRVSDDCGQNFTTVYREEGADLATVSVNTGTEFVPSPDQWSNEVIELFEFAGASRLVIQIINIGDGGNNLYLDNINLTDGCASSLQINSGDLVCGDACEGYIDLILNGFVQNPVITWSNNVNGQTGESLENLCAGTYSVTVVDTEFDCEHIQEVSIGGPDVLELFVIGNDISFAGANNGSAIATADGGTAPYSFIWDDANQFQESFLTGLQPGVYCVTVTDGNGCIQSDCVEVVGFECELEVSVVITQPTCGGNGIGSGEVVVTNTQGNTTIFWSKGGPPQTGGLLFNSPTNDNLTEGEFFIRITDSGVPDCFEEFYFEIFPATLPAISPVLQDESNIGSNDGSITLNTVDDDSDYSYLWSNGEVTEDIEDLPAGTYMVTINDINNDCELVETFVIENLNCTLEVQATIQPVSCFEQTDGMVSLSATGGTPPYVFGWPVGPNVDSQGNLAAGIYDITVSDQAGCRVVYEAIVEQPALLDMLLSTSDETTPGALDGSASTTVFGGTPPYQYEWSNGALDTDIITGLGGGIFLVTVTDANNCTTVKGASVEGKICPEMTLEVVGTNVTCFGQEDGTLGGVVSGGVEPYSYLWTPGNFTTLEVTDVPPGEYTLMAMDAEGCPTTAITSIAQPEEFIVTLSGMNESALGEMDGFVESMVSGGVGTITFSWSGPPSFTAGTPNIESLGPADYCLDVVDETQCTAQACFTVGAGADQCAGFTNDNVELALLNNVLCFGEENGSAMAITLGGTPPYNYLWSNNETGETAVNLPSGESFVTITDANECETVTSVMISEPTELAIVEFGSEDVLCRGEATGIAIAAATGGVEPYTFAWSNMADTESVSDLEAGDYELTITDSNNCIVVNSFTIEQPDMGIEISASSSNVSIVGAMDGSAEAEAIGGAGEITFAWSGPGDFTAVTPIISNLGPGTYCVIATDSNNCSKETCIEVAGGAIPNCGSFGIELSIEEVSCSGFNNGAIEVSVINGEEPFMFTWSDPSLPDTDIQQNLLPGEYSVTVTDAVGCVTTSTAIIISPSPVEVEIEVQPISSPGAADAILTAVGSGGVGSYGAIWEENTDGLEFGPVGPGEYCVVLFDANGCEDEACITIEDAILDCSGFEAELVLSRNVTCFGDEDGELIVNILSGAEPITYAWSGGLPGTRVQSNLPTGTYAVTVTDANNCEYVDEAEITGPDSELTIALSATNVTAMGGQDGTASVVASGGDSNEEYTYIWNDGAGQTTATASGLAAGEYCVTVGSGSCSAVDCIEVAPFLDICAEFTVEESVTDASCFGACDGTVDLITMGGQAPFDFAWSDGQQGFSIETCAGPGAVTITDANGCQAIINFIVDEPAEIDLFASATDATNATTNDGTANAIAFGGTTPFTYEWSNEESGSDISDLAPGEYTVTATDASGCFTTASVVVGVMDDICDGFSATFEVQNVSCFGEEDGVITVDAQGGSGTYFYDYSIGTSLGATQGNVGVGDFIITVTDANDCEIVLQGAVTEPEELIINVLEVNNTSDDIAADGSITIGIDGGSEPYEIDWSVAFGNVTEVSALTPGTYTVTVTDDNGCVSEQSIMVGSDGTMANCESLSADYLITPVSCFGGADGSIVVEPSGGTGPYDIATSLPSFSGLIASTYAVTITDDAGCIFIDQINLPQPAELVANSLGFDGTCGALAIAELVISGGAEPYDILWSTGASSTFISNLETGTYTYEVEDASGCVTNGSVDVVSDFVPLEFEVATDNASCADTEDGAIVVNISNGVEPYTYLWNDGIQTRNRVNIPGGEYTLQITDGNGCQFVLSRTIISPTNLVASFDVEQGATSDLFDVTVNASGGTPPYQYDWSDGGNNFLNLGLAIGNYTVTITDDNLCTELIEVQLDGTTATLDNLDIISSFNLSPNPTNGQFFLDIALSQPATVNVAVYDILGQNILLNAYNGANINEKLDLSNQPSGTYYVRLFNETGQLTKKLIKVD